MNKLKIKATSDERLESDAWLENYANEDERKRRRMVMPDKLARLGLTSEYQNHAILDMCCGHGESLDTLDELGFTNLSGIDLTITEELAADPRFNITQGDVTQTKLPANSFDWIICIHSLHHLASAENVALFVDECHRLLKPGGKVAIIDFPASPQIKAAFWFFRQPKLHFTPYLKYFGQIIQEEWSFLQHYLPQWPTVRKLLWKGQLTVERSSSSVFYYYLTLKKPNN